MLSASQLLLRGNRLNKETDHMIKKRLASAQFRATATWTRAGWRRSVVLCLTASSLLLGLSWSAHAQAFTTFDVPGSVNTVPTSINKKGKIAGFCGDSNGVWHGFVRAADGRAKRGNDDGLFHILL